MKVGQHDQAIQEYANLGQMLIQRDKLDEAERLYRHALEQKPPTGEFLAPLCEALMEAGRGPVAREFLDAGLSRSPDSKALQALNVRAQLMLGEGPKALVKARQLLAAQPENDEVRALVGRVFLSAGESFQARDVLLPAARRLVERGDFAAAQTLLRDLIKAMPHDAQVLNAALRAFEPAGETEMVFNLKAALAESQFRSGEHDIARRLYVELLKTDPNNARFRERMAQLDGGVGQAAAIAEPEPEPVSLADEVEAEEILEIEVPSPPAAAAKPKPRPQAAQAKAEPAPSAPPAGAPFDPRERLAEANVFAKYGLLDKAVAHLEEIVRHFPVDFEAREKLVSLYLEQGRAEEAAPLAVPLAQFYREGGDAEALDRLVAALPQLGEEVSPKQTRRPVMTAVEEEEEAGVEEVVVVELGEEELGAAAEGAVEEPSFEIQTELAGDESMVEIAEAPTEDDAIIEIAEAPTADDAVIEIAEEPVGDRSMVGIDEGSVDEDFSFEIKTEPVEDFTVALIEEAETRMDLLEVEATEPEVELMSTAGLAAAEALTEEVVGEAEETGFARAAGAKAAIDEQSGAYQVLDELEKSLSIPMGKPKAAARKPVAEVKTAPPARRRVAEVKTAPAALPVVEPARPAAVEPETHLEEQLVEITDSFSGPSLSDLQQIDFYIGQELYEDALRILHALEKTFPDDQEVVLRHRALKEKGILLDAVSTAAEEASEELFADEQDYFDLAKELEEELAEEEAMVDEATGRGQEEAELEEVFREFQKGVAEQLSEEDSDTHFNLGIAYKEMGLLPEAIREFQISSRDQTFFVESCSMIAVCYLEQGMADQAAEWYRKALAAPTLNRDTALALRYDLAAALEMAGDPAQATEVYGEIRTADPAYRDVAQRIRQLAGHSQVN